MEPIQHSPGWPDQETVDKWVAQRHRFEEEDASNGEDEEIEDEKDDTSH